MNFLSPRTSLQSRFLLASIAMLLPLLALSAGTLISMDAAFHKSDLLLHETAIEAPRAVDTQMAILRAENGISGYVDDRNTALQVASRLKAVDQAFAQALSTDFDDPAEKDPIEAALKKWSTARTIGQTILNQKPANESAPLRKLEKEFQSRADLTASAMGDIHADIIHELKVQRSGAANARHTTIAVILGATLLGMLFASMIAVLLARAIVYPMSALKAGAVQLGAGNLAYRVPVTTTDEIGSVARAFNEMGAQLEDSRGVLETRVKERTAELEQANDGLMLQKTIKEAQGEASFDGILVISGDDEIISYNQHLLELWGFSANTLATWSGQETLRQITGKLHDPESEAGRLQTLGENEKVHQELKLEDSRIFECRSAPVIGTDQACYGRIWFFRDISEQKLADIAVRLAKDEAEHANLAKSEFLSRMSHELRTPLNAILGFGQILEMRSPSAQDSESVQQILKGGRHLLELINEILEISGIEAGRMSLSIEPIEMVPLLSEVMDLVQPLANQRNVRLINQASNEETTTKSSHVMADRQRLKQVLLNLLSNAIKYNHEGGTVTLLLQEKADTETTQTEYLRIAVRDTGPGIALADQPKLFVLFERLGAERTETEGTGIGLVLARKLTELMHGRMGLESDAGRGSTFWIELPIAEPTLVDLGSVDYQSANPEKSLLSVNRRVTLLYIEDNMPNVRLIENLIQETPQVRLLTAMQGSVGLDLARQQHPDIILLDLHLPDIQGDEVLLRLRADPATAHIPVVMLSADATSNQIDRLLNGGARHYLTKPLNIKQLVRVIEELLDGEIPEKDQIP